MKKILALIGLTSAAAQENLFLSSLSDSIESQIDTMSMAAVYAPTEESDPKTYEGLRKVYPGACQMNAGYSVFDLAKLDARLVRPEKRPFKMKTATNTADARLAEFKICQTDWALEVGLDMKASDRCSDKAQMFLSNRGYNTANKAADYTCEYSYKEPFFQGIKEDDPNQDRAYKGYKLRFVSEDKNGPTK